jgi:hypothetical protein
LKCQLQFITLYYLLNNVFILVCSTDLASVRIASWKPRNVTSLHNIFKKNKMAALKVMFCTWLIFVHEVRAHNCSIHNAHFSGTKAEHVLAFKLISECTLFHFGSFTHILHSFHALNEVHTVTWFFNATTFHSFTFSLQCWVSSGNFTYFSAQKIFSSNIKWNHHLSPLWYVSSRHWSQYFQSIYTVIIIFKMHASCEHFWNSSFVTIPSLQWSRSKEPILI